MFSFYCTSLSLSLYTALPLSPPWLGRWQEFKKKKKKKEKHGQPCCWITQIKSWSVVLYLYVSSPWLSIGCVLPSSSFFFFSNEQFCVVYELNYLETYYRLLNNTNQELTCCILSQRLWFFIYWDRICTLDVARILEDIKLICGQFVSISFVFVTLKCNRAALALASVVKENEEAIVWLEECPSFFFPIVHVILIK